MRIKIVSIPLTSHKTNKTEGRPRWNIKTTTLIKLDGDDDTLLSLVRDIGLQEPAGYSKEIRHSFLIVLLFYSSSHHFSWLAQIVYLNQLIDIGQA